MQDPESEEQPGEQTGAVIAEPIVEVHSLTVKAYKS
jgi:hypothetical protein